MSTEEKAPTIRFVSQDIKEADGVLFFPKVEKVFNSKPIHWIFVADCSGSMQEKVGEWTRWEIAVKLIWEAIRNIQSHGRVEDTLTLLCFNYCVKTIFNAMKISQIDNNMSHFDIQPEGSTNIEMVNALVHLTMMLDLEVLEGRRNVAELFFTDGCATQGLCSAQQLYDQKIALHQVFLKQMSVPALDHFIWCAAIGNGDREVVKKLSQTSRHSLWVTVNDMQVMNFAAEMGTAVAAALCSRCIEFDTHLMGKVNIRQHHAYWLLNDTCGMIYSDQIPFSICHGNSVDIVVCPNIVTLYRIQNTACKLAEDEDVFYLTMNETLLKRYMKEVENIKLPPIFSRDGLSEEDSRDILSHYEKTYTSLMLILEELLTKYVIGLPSTLERQYSCFRQSSGESGTVRAISSSLQKAFQAVTLCANIPENEEKQPSSPDDIVFVSDGKNEAEEDLVVNSKMSPPKFLSTPVLSLSIPETALI